MRLSGYESYIVGGCVRDLLMGMKPKDFDVATNATPEQVRVLFSRSRIIGRRFQIVHVRVGSEMIEVTTFRAQHTEIKNELRSEEHTSELQSQSTISYAVFCLKKKKKNNTTNNLYPKT